MRFLEAINQVRKSKKRKFDETLDANILLNLKENQKNEVIRGFVQFPNKFGFDKRVVVFAEEVDLQNAAIESGAVRAGSDDLLKEVSSGEYVDFDVVIATPSIMPKLIKLGKVLGPKGLMPNPKDGTVTSEISAAVKKFKQGSVNFKSQQGQGTINLAFGKLSQSDRELQENFTALLLSIKDVAGKFCNPVIKRAIIKSTMSAAYLVDTNL
ncbi:50S ribosomal protein L1 [Candidatus Dojkabacteria bacterium]|uniref:Ribosomal protein n=1 Tax=Candidatus Dojkabacteria bacterium TaxID=2099670 RepID=A0A3M0YZE1_9BACT|nr:MAG: 50S ribosomal protein L1 [Candidatus Dojkabacteria bacterium]